MTKNSQSGVSAALFAAVIVSLIPITGPAQSTESISDSTPDAVDTAQSGEEKRTQDGVQSQDGSLEDLSDQIVVDVEMQRRLNELRREQLDDRATTITWWLAAVAIVLTLFSVVAAIAGFLGFRRFEAIRSGAEESARDARKLVEEIRKNRDESRELVQEITAEAAAEDPGQAGQAIKDVLGDPDATLMDRAVADAVSLQKAEEIEDAVEKWRAIANIAEGTDKNLAARAWSSIGYLLPRTKAEDKILAYNRAISLRPNSAVAINNRGVAKRTLKRFDEAIADHDEAIRLRPGYARAYYGRGLAKRELRRFDEALADYDEAIRLRPDYALAYYGRGRTKRELKQFDAAITDYDEAIRLRPDYARAYYGRGLAKHAMRRFEEAQEDFQIALKLAKEVHNTNLASRIEQHLR